MDARDPGHEFAVSALQVLVVEDDPDFAEGLAEVLELEGHAVAVSASGEEALEVFSETPCHVVIMDVQLPGMNGVDCARALKAIDDELVVILITGYSAQTLVEEALRIGVDGFLQKPLDTKSFLERVEHLGRDRLGGPARPT